MTLTLIDLIDALLPQTQCQKCGFNGCRPYAEAIAHRQADINQCPPGGEKGIAKLAQLLGVDQKPLNPTFGVERPRWVAVIDESNCIGCTKCMPPCPADAILGTSKQMHTVIASECTGCELCVAPCPVNCITMKPASVAEWTPDDASRSRRRFQAKKQRLARLETEKAERLHKQKQLIAKIKKHPPQS